MSFVIAAKRLRETPSLLAFHHPRPAYPVHILILPKKSLRGLQELSASDADFLTDLFRTVQTLVEELYLETPGYRLIVNGGKYQDFPFLHFHLVSGEPG